MAKQFTIGYIPILCTAPLFYAHQNGIFQKYGLNVTLKQTTSWSNLRDQMLLGLVDGAHMPVPMPIAANLGLYGKEQNWRLLLTQSINGIALTLSNKYRNMKDLTELKGAIIGVPHLYSMYYYLLCDYLASHGVDPLKDVTIREVAPRLLSYYMENGKLDGIHAPEPYNQLVVHKGHGFIHHLSRDIWQGHPCCGFAIHPRTYDLFNKESLALRDALIQASFELHTLSKSEKIRFAESICQRNYLDIADPIPVIQSLIGDYPDGLGQFHDTPDRIDYLPNVDHNTGYWILSQMQRWGQVTRSVDYKTVIAKTYAPDTQSAIDRSPFGQLSPKSGRTTKTLDLTTLEQDMMDMPFSKYYSMDEQVTALPVEMVDHIKRIVQHIREVSANIHQEELPRSSPGIIGELEAVLSDLVRNVQFARDLADEQRLNLENNVQLRTQELETAYMRSNMIRTELQESKEKLNVILDHIPYYVMELNRDGRIQYINKHTEQLKLDGQDYVGETFYQFVFSDTREEHEQLIDMVFKDGATHDFESRSLFDFDHDNWFHYIYMPLTDMKGKVRSVLLIALDITAEKDREDLLESARTHAEEANKTKSQFLANMSHEIRTPMNGIIGMTELLQQEHLTSKQSEYVEMIRSSANSLLVIINDILDLSKIEAGKLTLEKVPYNIQELIYTITAPFKIQAEQKGILLNIDVNPSLPSSVFGDPTRLRQIVNNLLSNAMKFTSSGSVTLRVSIEDCRADVCTMGFAVIDTGTGIPKDKLGLIFDSFSQADISITRKYGGTGLGLTISQKLIQMMGGEGMSVRSTFGSGSTFSFMLPFEMNTQVKPQISPALDVPTIDHRGAHPLLSDDELQPLDILVAEDNAVNQTLIRALLEPAGHKVTIVSNGLQAIEAYSEHAFDCILMDGSMPEMDGLEATRQIRKLEQETGLHIPIVALTASALKSDRDQFLQAGMDEYITKPIDTLQLKQVLQSIQGTVQYRPETLETLDLEEEMTEVPVEAWVQINKDDFYNRFKLLPKTTVTEIIHIYEEEATEVIDLINQTLPAHEMNNVQEQVHRLKGMVANFCADPLSAQLQDIEIAARDGLEDVVTGLWNTVTPKLERLSVELEAIAHEYE